MGKCCGGSSPAERGALSSSTTGDPDRRTYKVIVVGEAGVGKSSVIDRMLGFPFHEGITSTIGVDFKTVERPIGDMKFKVQIWDTAGQERFRSLADSYFRGAHLVIFIYDVSQLATFEALSNYWIEHCATQSRGKEYLKVLIGNKTDLLHDEKDAIPKKNLRALVNLDGWMYARTSAKSSAQETITRQFTMILDALIQRDPSINFEALMREDAQKKFLVQQQKNQRGGSSSNEESDMVGGVWGEMSTDSSEEPDVDVNIDAESD